MDQIGIRELRSNIAEVVRAAGKGIDMVVTVDGLPVAQLGPLRPPEGPAEIQQLVARGELTPPLVVPTAEPSIRISLSQGQRIDRLVREIRGR